VFPWASDTFFELWDLEEALGGRKVDFAFIDGMHLFEYALRDFANLERYCTPESVVVLHPGVAARKRPKKGWTGDVWKLAVCLRRYRPDLQLSVLDIPASGLGIVRGLDPESNVLHSKRGEILRELLPLGLDSSLGREAKESRLPGDWETLRSVLPDRPFRRGSRSALKTQRFMRIGPAKLARRVRGPDALSSRLRERIEEPGVPRV
jgi:hypothetical protein